MLKITAARLPFFDENLMFIPHDSFLQK